MIFPVPQMTPLLHCIKRNLWIFVFSKTSLCTHQYGSFLFVRQSTLQILFCLKPHMNKISYRSSCQRSMHVVTPFPHPPLVLQCHFKCVHQACSILLLSTACSECMQCLQVLINWLKKCSKSPVMSQTNVTIKGQHLFIDRFPYWSIKSKQYPAIVCILIFATNV